MIKRQISISGLAAAVQGGYKLQNEFPHIDELLRDYRGLMSRAEIVSKYSLTDFLETSDIEIAKSAVGCAIRGSHLNKVKPNYEGLVSEEEADKLHLAHRVNAGQKLCSRGRGLFSNGVPAAPWSSEEKDALYTRYQTEGYKGRTRGEDSIKLVALTADHNAAHPNSPKRTVGSVKRALNKLIKARTPKKNEEAEVGST